MKILFLTPWYPDDNNPNHGVFVRDQVEVLSSKHEVRVISAKVDYNRFALSKIACATSTFGRVRELRILVRRSLPVFNQFNFFLRTVCETLRQARDFRPDVIHGNIGYPGSFWAWCVSRLLHVPYVVTEHTRITNNFRSSLHRMLTLFGLRRARVIIAVSQWHADEIQSWTGKKPVVIPNVIRFSEMTGMRKRSTGKTIHIGFLGGLNTPVKGLDILLRAASALRSDFRLHIGGDGVLLNGYRDQARQLGIEDRCVFYGRIPHAKVADFMEQIDIFVNASRWETFGIAMVEALAAGVPVVATDSGGSREFVDSTNGVIVPVDHADGLRDAIESVGANLSAYDPVSISRSVKNKFSTELFLEKIENVFTEAITDKVS